MTYAIKRSERLRMQPVERLFSWLLFDVTTHYGMSPGNALRWLAILIVAFSIPYMVAIGFPLKAGIWAIWSKDRICKEDGNELPARVTQDFLFPSARSKWWGPGALTRLLLGSFYFSVLSAFSLGWRDLNVGAWISRLQPREYFLRGTGWARVISGIQ